MQTLVAPRLNTRTQHQRGPGVSADFPVQQIFSTHHARTTRAVRVADDGITLVRMPDDTFIRYVWLSFTLPGTNEVIRALGEIQGSSGELGYTRIRFKHIFPDHRTRLLRFLDAHRQTLH